MIPKTCRENCVFKLWVGASMGTDVCRLVCWSVCLCVEKNEIQRFYWIFVENSQVIIGEHQSIKVNKL